MEFSCGTAVRIQHYHYSRELGGCSGVGLIPGLGTSTSMHAEAKKYYLAKFLKHLLAEMHEFLNDKQTHSRVSDDWAEMETFI